MELKKAWNDKDVLNPKFLGSWDIPNESTLIVQIQSAKTEMVDNFKTNQKENKLIIYFFGNYKPMVCNITNAKAISLAHGSKYLEDWANKWIEIGTKKIRAFGETQNALRVKAEAPKIPTKIIENLSPDHEKWNGAIEALKNGKVTIEAIEKGYNLTPENKELLCKLSK